MVRHSGNDRTGSDRFNPYHRQLQLRSASEAALPRTKQRFEPDTSHQTDEDKDLEEELHAAARKAKAEVLKREIAESVNREREKTTLVAGLDDKMKALRSEQAELIRKEAEMAKEKEEGLREAAIALRRVIQLKTKLAEVEDS